MCVLRVIALLLWAKGAFAARKQRQAVKQLRSDAIADFPGNPEPASINSHLRGNVSPEDAQFIVDTVAALGKERALSVITSILRKRPEIALDVVTDAVPKLTYPPATAIVGPLIPRFKGVIRVLFPGKGYGSIESPEVRKTFGSEVFLHIKQAGNLKEGMSVKFAIMLNKDKRPQAYDVKRSDDTGYAKGQDVKTMVGGISFSHREELGRFSGVVKSFNPVTHYGWISCEVLIAQTQRNVYVHETHIGNFKARDPIFFTAYMYKGHVQAKDLRHRSVAP